jgi:hypothetical protein
MDEMTNKEVISEARRVSAILGIKGEIGQCVIDELAYRLERETKNVQNSLDWVKRLQQEIDNKG